MSEIPASTTYETPRKPPYSLWATADVAASMLISTNKIVKWLVGGMCVVQFCNLTPQDMKWTRNPLVHLYNTIFRFSPSTDSSPWSSSGSSPTCIIEKIGSTAADSDLADACSLQWVVLLRQGLHEFHAGPYPSISRAANRCGHGPDGPRHQGLPPFFPYASTWARFHYQRITEQSRSTKEENKKGKDRVHHYYTYLCLSFDMRTTQQFQTDIEQPHSKLNKSKQLLTPRARGTLFDLLLVTSLAYPGHWSTVTSSSSSSTELFWSCWIRTIK
jgi:hypothetical protein